MGEGGRSEGLEVQVVLDPDGTLSLLAFTVNLTRVGGSGLILEPHTERSKGLNVTMKTICCTSFNHFVFQTPLQSNPTVNKCNFLSVLSFAQKDPLQPFNQLLQLQEMYFCYSLTCIQH